MQAIIDRTSFKTAPIRMGESERDKKKWENMQRQRWIIAKIKLVNKKNVNGNRMKY